jgi:hypothetical protein
MERDKEEDKEGMESKLEEIVMEHSRMIDFIIQQNIKLNAVIGQLTQSFMNMKRGESPPRDRTSYELRLGADLPCPIVKSKQFAIEVELVDRAGRLFENRNKVNLDLQALAVNDLATPIESRGGYSILTYSLDSHVQGGKGLISKIKINELTSKYPSGWIYLRVSLREQSLKMEEGFVEAGQVAPLLIKKVVVKSSLKKDE